MRRKFRWCGESCGAWQRISAGQPRRGLFPRSGRSKELRVVPCRRKKAAEQGDVTAEGNLRKTACMALEWAFRKDSGKCALAYHRRPGKTATQLPSSASECSALQGAGVLKDEVEESSGCASPLIRAMLPVSLGLELPRTLAQGVTKDTAETLRCWYCKAGDQGLRCGSIQPRTGLQLRKRSRKGCIAEAGPGGALVNAAEQGFSRSAKAQ